MARATGLHQEDAPPDCATEEQVLVFVEGRMDPSQRSTFERHLGSCESCSELVAAVAAATFADPSPAPSVAPSLGWVAGQRVGPYVVLGFAGRGSMGEVYRARDPRFDRDVAIKILPARLADDPERLARFQVEARAAGGIGHANTLTVFDLGTHESKPYLVSEWLEGTTLKERLVLGPLPPADVIRIGAEIAQGLAAAHAKGVIHRDLKPANLFLCHSGACKILDFGLARLASPHPDGDETQPGTLLGTAGYMAPEQVRGHPVDLRADLFSLGTILYEMIAGHPAFGGDNPVERMSATLRDDPSSIGAGELGSLIARCLAKDPADRFQSAQDLAFHLAFVRDRLDRPTAFGSPPAPSRQSSGSAIRSGWPVAAALVLAVLVAVGVVVVRPTAEPTAPATPTAPTIDRPIYRALSFGRGRILSARYANDGQTVVYGAAWDGGPAQLHSTRSDRPGSTPLGVGANVLSASNLGLAIQLEPTFLDGTVGVGTLARMPWSGGAPREVLEQILEAEWIPGSDELAVLRKVKNRFRLESPLGTVRHETEAWISHFRIAPRGDKIAFLLHPDPKDDAGAVVVLEGRAAPRELSSGWSSIRGLAWAPEKPEEIWFTATRAGGDYQLFAVDLDGHLRLVDRVAGRIVLHDIAPNGDALLDHQVKRVGLVVGDENGERDLTWSDTSFLTDLSADGSTVLFSEGETSEGSNYGVYMRSTDGAPPVRLGEGSPLALSPDGRWVLAMHLGPPISLSVLPTKTGSSRDVELGPISMILGARIFPDSRRVLLLANESGRPPRLWIHDLGDEGPRPITPEGVDPFVEISPDGRRFAGIDTTATLRVFSARGDDLGAVPGRFEAQRVAGWTRDGQAVFTRTLSVPVHIARVDLETGVATPHLTLPRGGPRPGLVSVLTLFLGAGGQTYAYCDYEELSRLYVAEGLSRPGQPESPNDSE